MNQLAILTPSRTPAYVARLSDALDACRGIRVPVAPPLMTWRPEAPVLPEFDPIPIVETPPSVRILVNNAATLEMTSTGLSHGWAVLEPGRNLSFSDANNLAAEAAIDAFPGLTHLLLLNDDAIPSQTFLARLWQHREEADVLGGLMLEADGRRVNHAGVVVDPKNCRTDHFGRGRPVGEFRAERVRYFANVTFAAALIPVQVWQALGGLDSTLIASHEDVDFCWRAIHAGFRVGCAMDAVAIHSECGTRARGGMADHQNHQTIEARYQPTLRTILETYRRRMHREHDHQVEGIL